mgnify:CR=1 FL=1
MILMPNNDIMIKPYSSHCNHSLRKFLITDLIKNEMVNPSLEILILKITLIGL